MYIGCAALAVRELRIREMKDIRILAPGYPMKHITYIWRFPERSCFTIQLLWSFLNPYYPRNFLHCHLRVSPSTLDRYNQSFTMKGKKVRGEHQHIVMWCIFFHNCIYHCYIMAVEKKGRFHDPTWRRDQFEWMTWCMITRVTWHINERHLSEWKCAATSNRQPTSLHIMDIYQTTRHNALFTTL